MSFYVYRHVTSDNKPFYVGKGSINAKFTYKRAHRMGRNPIHRSIVNKYGCKVQIIKHFYSEAEAYEFEETLIKLYKFYGLCKANISVGGVKSSLGSIAWNKGKSGVQAHSDDTRAVLSKKFKGTKNPAWNGYCHTPFGVFESVTEAMNVTGLCRKTINKRCKSNAHYDWFISTENLSGK